MCRGRNHQVSQSLCSRRIPLWYRRLDGSWYSQTWTAFFQLIILMTMIIKSKARDFTFRSLAFVSRLERKPFIIILSSSFSEKKMAFWRGHIVCGRSSSRDLLPCMLLEVLWEQDFWQWLPLAHTLVNVCGGYHDLHLSHSNNCLKWESYSLSTGGKVLNEVKLGFMQLLVCHHNDTQRFYNVSPKHILSSLRIIY